MRSSRSECPPPSTLYTSPLRLYEQRQTIWIVGSAHSSEVSQNFVLKESISKQYTIPTPLLSAAPILYLNQSSIIPWSWSHNGLHHLVRIRISSPARWRGFKGTIIVDYAVQYPGHRAVGRNSWLTWLGCFLMISDQSELHIVRRYPASCCSAQRPKLACTCLPGDLILFSGHCLGSCILAWVSIYPPTSKQKKLCMLDSTWQHNLG